MIKLRNVPCRVSTGIYVSMIIRDVHDIQQNERANISYRCNRLKCPRLDCPPTCLFPIRIIPTPYKLIPWPLWPMLNHWRPDNLARGHLSLLHRYECHLIGLLGLVPGQNAPCIRKTIQIYSVNVMTHVIALKGEQSSQGTLEPISPVRQPKYRQFSVHLQLQYQNSAQLLLSGFRAF